MVRKGQDLIPGPRADFRMFTEGLNKSQQVSKGVERIYRHRVQIHTGSIETVEVMQQRDEEEVMEDRSKEQKCDLPTSTSTFAERQKMF